MTLVFQPVNGEDVDEESGGNVSKAVDQKENPKRKQNIETLKLHKGGGEKRIKI